MSWRLFIGLILLLAVVHRGKAQVILDDDFSGGIAGWQFVESCNCGYELHLWETDPDEGVVPPALTWQKNNICDCACENDVWCEGGQTCFGCGACQSYEGYFYKSVAFPDGVTSFTLSFDWRSSSNLDWSIVTNSALRVTNENGDLIIQEDLIMGGTFDTGWQYFEESFELDCAYWNEITIYFDVIDSWWETPWCNKNWWDNVKVEIIEQGESSIEVNSNSPVCLGETIALSASGGQSYVWSGPNGFLSSSAQVEIDEVTMMNEGEYVVNVTDEFGCEFELSANVVVEEESVLNIEQSLCEGSEFELPDGELVSEPGNYQTVFVTQVGCDSVINIELNFTETYELYVDTVICPDASFQDAEGNVIETGGLYLYEYESTGGCDSTVYVDVSFETIPTDTINVAVCPGEEFVTVDGNILNTPGTFLEYNDSDSECGSYTLYSFSWLPSPMASFQYEPPFGTSNNSEATFQNTSEGADEIYWNLFDLGIYYSETLSIDFSDEPNTHPVCLVSLNDEGCSDSTCIDFIIREDVNIFIPNTFSPNGDGVNDLFYVVASGLDPSDFELVIFNRWGELIFEGNSIDQKWDGRNKSGTHYVSDGIYPYIFKAGLLDSPERIERIGHVTVLR